MDKTKPFDIPKPLVMRAYKLVKANAGSAGVDKQSLADFESDLDHARQNLDVEIVNFEDLDLLDDLDEVAALSAALDIAISVSTTVSAISAGVGTETWLLSWKESPRNNILFAPRGPKVINFERSVTDTWEPAFMEISQMITDRVVQSTSS